MEELSRMEKDRDKITNSLMNGTVEIDFPELVFYSRQGAYNKIPLILKMRKEGKTLREIGKHFSLSAERIRMLEAVGNEKIRNLYGTR